MWYQTRRNAMALFIAGSVLLACDQPNSAARRSPALSPSPASIQDDDASAQSGQTEAIQLRRKLTGASYDGGEVDMTLYYTISPPVREFIRAGGTVSADYVDGDGNVQLLKRAVIDNITFRGEMDVTIPATDPLASVRMNLDGVREGELQGFSKYGTLHLPQVFEVEDTDLSTVNSWQASLVKDSYSTELSNGRRIHRFAINVTDEKGMSITGLEKRAFKHFEAIENDVVDTESPVTVDHTRHNLAVYLVLDVSGSMVSSGQAHNLLDAVTRTVIALANSADFDYRIFTGQTYPIASLRDIDFDNPDLSGTALYAAIDSALYDIENYASEEQNKIMIVFTDGMDRSSVNHYDAFINQDQVRQYIAQRLKNVRTTQQLFYKRGFKSYFVSFDDSSADVDEEVLKRLAEAGAGKHYDNVSDNDIQGAFGRVVEDVRGVYYLEYNSQVTRDNTDLRVKVYLNDRNDPGTVVLPTKKVTEGK